MLRRQKHGHVILNLLDLLLDVALALLAIVLIYRMVALHIINPLSIIVLIACVGMVISSIANHYQKTGRYYLRGKHRQIIGCSLIVLGLVVFHNTPTLNPNLAEAEVTYYDQVKEINVSEKVTYDAKSNTYTCYKEAETIAEIRCEDLQYEKFLKEYVGEINEAILATTEVTDISGHKVEQYYLYTNNVRQHEICLSDDGREVNRVDCYLLNDYNSVKEEAKDVVEQEIED